MKLKTIFLAMLASCFISCGQKTENVKSENLSREQMRAKDGDEVLIVVTYVKDESKSDFEKWINDVLYAALNKTTNPMKIDQLKVTRWLEPTQQNEDKTWTYVWIMDPIIPNTDYDIPTFLNKEYGEEKGKEHWEKYQTFWAKPVEVHALKQTSL
jgi:hypothetical protein